MQKAAINPATGNTVTFAGGESEYDAACWADEQAQSEWDYEQWIRAMYAGGMSVQEIAEAEAMPVSDVEYMIQ
jgi:hypothetical protein